MSTSHFNRSEKVSVCSRSFSRHPFLREKLLEKYENVQFNDKGLILQGETLVEFLKDSDKTIIGLEKIDSNILSQLPRLKVISKYGVGIDGIQFKALQERNVSFGWTGGVNKRSVSELALSMMLLLLRKLPIANERACSGEWKQLVGNQLSEKKVGIVGLGHVGKDLARILKVFSCEIWANDLVYDESFCNENYVRKSDLKTLLENVDIVTLHVPLDDSTKGLIGVEELGMMKETSLLINTCRGGVVEESALREALEQGKIAAAALDVLELEPPTEFEWFKTPNLFITPHLGGAAEEAICAMGLAAIQGLDSHKEALVENFR